MIEKHIPPKKKSSFLSRILFLLNISASFSLFLAHLASFVSPARFWWLAIFGISFGIIAFSNFIFMVFWIVLRDRRFFLSLLALILVYDKLFGIYQFRSEEKQKPEHGVKVMTYNVRLFDLYNWNHNNTSKEIIFKMLQKQNPDILCFQEFYSSEGTAYKFNNADTLKKVLSCPYSHIYYSITLRKTDHWGMAMYSRYPIINKKVIQFSSKRKRAFMYSDIVIGRDTIRVMNVHMESIGFKEADYRYLETLGDDSSEVELRGALNIGRRLKRAFVRRSYQAEKLKEEISKSPYPVIVCGDFNDTPSSFAYHTVSSGMKDAYRISGGGSGKTYIGAFPSFRIDYILHSPSLKSSGYTTLHEKLSDHYPVTCYFERAE